MMLQFKKDKLDVLVYDDRQSLGEAAAKMVSSQVKYLLQTKHIVNIIFAAAPSQNEFLYALRADDTVPWKKINAFHMDEYLGLEDGAPQLFSRFLRAKLFDHVSLRSVNFINGNIDDIQKECYRYAALLKDNPPDIVCMGIGENTHLAFNDPIKADFNDPEMVKLVDLDTASRQQQVNDGCFATLPEVSLQALTLTIPALMKAKFIYCMVPGKTKSAAVKHTLKELITEEYPSTILRTHDAATLFIDRDSYNDIRNDQL